MSRRTLVFLVALLGCGSRSAPFTPDPPKDAGVPSELCNGLDDDRNGRVDDPFRNDAGSYLNSDHCGACNVACTADSSRELSRSCRDVSGAPRCVADACLAGFGLTRDGRCAPLGERFCLSCTGDEDCGTLVGATCARIAGESRCSVSCTTGCPAGTACNSALGVCTPPSGSCSCDPGDSFTAACTPQDSKSVDGGVCVGEATCQAGVYSACAVGAELCDEQDNDCDGETDEDFRDTRGAYSVSLSNCGRCGNVCEASPVPGFEIACAGDPFAPSCVLACPDAIDGIGVGDMLDANRAFEDACECRVSSLTDLPGPRGGLQEALDVDCDGADGRVIESFYVAVDGDDSGPGSPTRPLATLKAALARAQASRSDATPRTRVFVAGGSYTEALTLVDGVSLYGGYRRDFRALDPDAYPTEVRAPSAPRVAYGAAVSASNIGNSATEIAWITFRGGDAIARAEPAVAGTFSNVGAQLTLRELVFWAGAAGEGQVGDDGAAGNPPASEAGAGQLPRASFEDAQNRCISNDSNRVRGGAGGISRCTTQTIQGGSGGSAACPGGGAAAGAGSAGTAGPAGAAQGGRGGDEAAGPILFGDACNKPRCCGLADFSVANDYSGPAPGGNGVAGTGGSAGTGCAAQPGRFTSPESFVPSSAAGGQFGSAGGGGGGGGAGGGVIMDWYFDCAWSDGLGGGGGGGGAGGCGGAGGAGGASGAPSVAMLLFGQRAPRLSGVTFRTSAGGRGGAGGAGGDGGSGGAGGVGGALALADRITPPLAGASPGARGGSGGAGGAGGGGGGGCGGASVGVWWASSGADVAAVRGGNTFQLASGGPGGDGGRGAISGGGGTTGEVRDVIVVP